MIVRDEEEMLPRCLAAVAPAVDEIVIVDTGSVDRTVEIAHEFGAKVIHREWTGSFSDARNVSFEAATGDWMMYLDADEVLVAEDVKRLRALTGRVWKEAFYLVETSYTGERRGRLGASPTAPCGSSATARTTASRGACTSRSPTTCRPTPHNRIEQTSVRVEHFGYLGAVRDAKEKSHRNIDLLRAQQRESAPSAFLHFNLGTEYAAIGDHALGADRVRARLGDGPPPGRGAPRLRARADAPGWSPRCGSRAARPRRSRSVEDGLELFPGFTDLVYRTGAGRTARSTATRTRSRLLEALHRDG